MAMTTIWTQCSRRCLPRRLDRVLRDIPNVHNIADDVLVDGNTEVPYDRSIITLLRTTRANNITFIIPNNIIVETNTVTPLWIGK